MGRDMMGRRRSGGHVVNGTSSLAARPKSRGDQDELQTIKHARKRGLDYIFSTTMVPPGKSFSFLEHMDAANECEHGALSTDAKKPAGCRCWVAGGAK
jgi:hypothetical protein